MTRVCLLGSPEVDLGYELLSRETSRDALATYDLERPFENALAVRTVSIGGAVSFLNDLQWYLVRFVDEALVQEPSVSDEEWLSRDLATALRNGDCEPADTGEHLKIYGLESASDDDGPPPATVGDDGDASEVSDDPPASAPAVTRPPRLVEPLYVRRVDGEVPEYDLRDVEETLVVRLTPGEFSP
ncbi:DUF5804 family protein [Natronobiforma cellulositropha]|uniref:DUF5804 family protein n=1 Tax=Natronobiforma cellulositropha TaxID=1679076 RepID=UPI0021D60193|nr:DUF5804 family protein [Natronobiforma cellulositropha]